MPNVPSLASLEDPHEFEARHIGITPDDERRMLTTIGAATRAALVDAVVPPAIRRRAGMTLPQPVSEAAALDELRAIALRNLLVKSCIGQGYHATHTPGVILRNVLQSPAWYTAYTPYQAEISQGRLEALVNFQTMVCDLTGLAVAGASMLDEGTAAAEAMTLAHRAGTSTSNRFFVADDVLPQSLAVIRTRAEPLGISIVVGPLQEAAASDAFAALFQYPGLNGDVHDLRPAIDALHARDALAIVAADLLALTLLAPPGEMGADIAVGTTQRFGMPMGNGGPHAGYLATRDEFKRSMPGRLVGVSIDVHGAPAYRLALQTREQHIRREKATSNICTAQVLPAVVASMFAVYHGPAGLQRIARRIASYAAVLAHAIKDLGFEIRNTTAFDTLHIATGAATNKAVQAALDAGYNVRRCSPESIGITLDETTRRADVDAIWRALASVATSSARTLNPSSPGLDWTSFDSHAATLLPRTLDRCSSFLQHPVFQRHHSETGMLRYLRSLADKDLALDRTMIPLGSCTMKLNATSEMIPITWAEFADVHPFAPADQSVGYELLREQFEAWLCQATGYSGVSLQPNAGSQGELAGLLVIRAWHAARGEAQRDVCLIPESAHGTNPASAQMAGLRVVVTRCDESGNVDLNDLAAKCEQHSKQLAAVMITYPSTYGVFDAQVKEMCALVHRHGGRVYVDGANMNALVGLAAPGEFGGDVSHLNLHKTFCIPHGGGGPGVGPVCVAADLVPYLPAACRDGQAPAARVGAISAAPLGNAAVLPISWMYMRMMGADGLRQATETAILSANYIAARLCDHFEVHFSGNVPGIKGGGVAHECILDLRPLKESSGVSAEDVAKRLIDYGFHAPTLSFPVPGTLMVEPTESESLAELDRFCDAMIAIRREIAQVESGVWPRDDNPLKGAPHTAPAVTATEWGHAYSREQAAYPVPALRANKYWSPVGRVDNVWGDRNLSCTCPPLSAYER